MTNSSGRTKLILSAMALVMVGCGVALFPTPLDVLDDRPVVRSDYPFHAFHAKIGQDFLRSHGTPYGYDPAFMAGYPKTPLFSASVNILELFATIIPGVFRAQKILTAAIPFLCLILFFVGATGFGYDENTIGLALFVMTALFWLSLPLIFILEGLLGFLLGIHLAFAALGRLEAGLLHGSLESYYLLMIMAMWVHPHTLLLTLALSGLRVLFPVEPKLRIRVLTPCIAIAATLLSFYFCHGDIIQSGRMPAFWTTSDWFEPFLYYLNLEPNQQQSGFLELVLICLALAECFRRESSNGERCLGLAIIGGFLVAFYLSFVPGLAQFEPRRHTATIALLGVGPACAWLVRAYDRYPQIKVVGVLSLIGLAGFVVQTAIGFRGILPVGLSSHQQSVVDWIRTEAPREGRILVEDSLYGPPFRGEEDTAYGLIPLLPILTGRQFVGGPCASGPLKHSFVDAVDGKAFRKPMSDVSYFLKGLDLYGVSTLLVWSKEAYTAAVALQGTKRVKVLGRLVAFTRPPPSLILEGRGQAQLTGRGLEVKTNHPPPEKLVLSLHHDDRLSLQSTSPREGTQLIPQLIWDDPVGFLTVLNPPEEFSITAR